MHVQRMEEYSRLNFLFPLVIDPRLDRKYVWKSLRILDQISKEKESMIDQQTTANSQRSRFFTFIIDFYYLLAVRCLLEFIRLASVNRQQMKGKDWDWWRGWPLDNSYFIRNPCISDIISFSISQTLSKIRPVNNCLSFDYIFLDDFSFVFLVVYK